MEKLDRTETTQALADEYEVLGGIIGPLTADELDQPSGCRGWTNADLVFHMLLDAQRALVAFNTPASPPPDRDFVNYWKAFSAADEDSHAHARFVRISAAARGDMRLISARWLQTTEAAIRACRTTDADPIGTQGYVLALADFIATLVVEAAIHHLDLIRHLDGKPGPAPTAVSITTATLDGLLQRPRPSHWEDLSYLLKGTGRQPLSDKDRSALGTAVSRIPLFS